MGELLSIVNIAAISTENTMKTNLDMNTKKRAQDSSLMAIAAQIRPLPENVVPSERFLEQLRKRLLALDVGYDTGYRAA